MSTKKRILICPLDWGLGHATRCIPIIKELRAQGAEVLLGTAGYPAALLAEAFPEIMQIPFLGYEIEYPAGDYGMAIKMLVATPRLRNRIKEEHETLQQIIEQHQIDGVISDNRFGLYTNQVPCVYLTHQLQIQAPAFKGALRKLHRSYIDKYDFCWVPDFEGADNLSGALSHNAMLAKNCQFVGPLSRFRLPETKPEIRYQLCVLLSGPEPQRTAFEQSLLHQLENFKGQVLLVRGLPGAESQIATPDHIEVHNHLPTEVLIDSILASKLVLSRPGYSTLMDLTTLGSKAIFVPTPGQTEQEYLAQLHTEKGHFFAMRQKEFDLQKAISASEQYTGFKVAQAPELLASAAHDFLAAV